jgi:osmotically-inducible protein OsmY
MKPGVIAMTAIKSLRSGVVVLLATLMITVACSKAPDDTKIASTIQSSFGSDSGLQGKQLAIQSNNGTVTLSGTVDNEAQREAASR